MFFISTLVWHHLPFVLKWLWMRDRPTMQSCIREDSPFGIHGPFLYAIVCLYFTPSVRVLTSGMLSTAFPIKKWTCQGCPLSSLIFPLIIKSLAQAIHCHPHITGPTVAQDSHKIGLYAMTCSSGTWPPLCDLLDHFSQLFMYKLNHSKSAMFEISLSSCLKSAITKASPFSWDPNSDIMYLAIHLTSPFDCYALPYKILNFMSNLIGRHEFQIQA